jgi:hypothetical protein
MVIYNVTTKVETTIAGEWLEWLQREHITQVISTNCFTRAVVHRLLDIDDSEGPTYVIQYYAHSKADYNRYIELHAERLRNESKRWGNKAYSFRTVMEVVD